MRLNIALMILMVLAGFSLTVYFDSAAPPALTAQEKTAPDFSFTDTRGKNHTLSGFKGKNVILNFWASWCVPCIREFPTLLDAAEQNKKDTVLIALSYDLDDRAMRRFLKDMRAKGHNWERSFIYIARDELDIAGKLFGTTKFPETFVIDGTGQIRDKFIGADWEISDVNTAIQKLR